MRDKIIGKQDRCGQHTQRNGQAIGSFHMRGILKINCNSATSDKEQKIDRRNIKLTFFFCWIADPEFGPQIQSHAFADQCKRSTDQGLAGNDRRSRGNNDSGDNEPGRHNAIKDASFSGIEYTSIIICEQPGTLTEIIQDQANLDIYPGYPDIGPSAMAKV